MIDTDPPRHTRLRGLVNRGFTPRAVAAYENLLRELTRAILDDALPQGEFDFIEHVAAPLPIQVLCRILGVPPEDNQLLIDWGDRMIGSTDPDHVGHLLRGPRVATATACCRSEARPRSSLSKYGHGIAEARRAQPRDDLVTEAGRGRDRRRAAHRARVRRDVPAARRRRQRDHPPGDRPRRCWR